MAIGSKISDEKRDQLVSSMRQEEQKRQAGYRVE